MGSRLVSTFQNLYDKLIPQNPKVVVKIRNALSTLLYDYISNFESNHSTFIKTHALYAQLSVQINAASCYFWTEQDSLVLDTWFNNIHFQHQAQYIIWLQSGKSVDPAGSVADLVKTMLDLDDFTRTLSVKLTSHCP